jgi:hypothetical protein
MIDNRLNLNKNKPESETTESIDTNSDEGKFNQFISILKKTPRHKTGFVKAVLTALPGCNSQPENIVSYMLSINRHISGDFNQYSRALNILIGNQREYFKVLMLLGADKLSLQKFAKKHLEHGKDEHYSSLSYLPGFINMLKKHSNEILPLISEQNKNNIAMILKKSAKPVVSKPAPSKRSCKKQNNSEIQNQATSDSNSTQKNQVAAAPEYAKKSQVKRPYSNAFFAPSSSNKSDKHSEKVSYKKQAILELESVNRAKKDIVRPMLLEEGEREMAMAMESGIPQHDGLSKISVASTDKASSLPKNDRKVNYSEFGMFNTQTTFAKGESVDIPEAVMELE